MNASHSRLILNYTGFSVFMTKPMSEDCLSTLFQCPSINAVAVYLINLLIPDYHIDDALVWVKRKYGFYAPSKLVYLILALFFYVTGEANDLIQASIIALFLIYFVFIKIELRDVSREGNRADDPGVDTLNFQWDEDDFDDPDEDDVDDPDEDDTDLEKRHQRRQVCFTISGVLWFMVDSEPLTWFDYDSWNLWNVISNVGLEWWLGAILLLLTHHALESVQRAVYGEVVFRSWKLSSIPIITIFSFLMANDQIWNLDAEQREQMARVYLLIYISLFSMSSYEHLKIAFINPYGLGEVGERAETACLRILLVCCLLLIFGSKLIFQYALSSGSFTRSPLPHLLVLVVNATLLLFEILVDNSLFCFVINEGTHRLLMFLKKIFLKLSYFAVLLSMLIDRGVMFVHVHVMAVLLCLILIDIWNFFEHKLVPILCIWFLPRASAEQLALHDDVCLVCHEEMDSAIVTPCNHLYHPRCLVAWLAKNNTCPLCRRAL